MPSGFTSPVTSGAKRAYSGKISVSLNVMGPPNAARILGRAGAPRKGRRFSRRAAARGGVPRSRAGPRRAGPARRPRAASAARQEADLVWVAAIVLSFVLALFIRETGAAAR